MKIDLSRKNPFSTYLSNFAANFTFGADFDDWVCETMLPALKGNAGPVKQSWIDVGAGSCYWALLFLQRQADVHITAVDPSAELILNQAKVLAEALPSVADRLNRMCQTVQELASECEGVAPGHGQHDCIYFMQSAHYVAHDDFQRVFRALAGLLMSGGRVVIQARNMTPDWYPWAFPEKWVPNVEQALHATDMFYRADRYANAFSAMPETFSRVEITESTTEVRVPRNDYWQRLEDRWIPTFMSEDIISPDLHRTGIDDMKRIFEEEGRHNVTWTEKYALVTAHV